MEIALNYYNILGYAFISCAIDALAIIILRCTYNALLSNHTIALNGTRMETVA